MLNVLSKNEKEVMLLIIQGYNFNSISEICTIDYKTYNKIKRAIYIKLRINGMNEILGALLNHGVIPEEI